MSHWPYILAAYVVTFAGTIGVTLWSWTAMRRAEAEAEELRK